jgi:hypothetical protein
LLAAHDPMPAMVLDIHWNAVQLNRGAQWLALMLMPWLAQAMQAAKPDQPLNIIDAMLHPEGMFSRLNNLSEVAPMLLGHLRADAQVNPALQPRVEQVAAMFKARLGAQPSPVPAQLAPVMTSRFETPHGELAFFSLFTTFGSPQHITLASLRVEHFCAADAHTREVLHREVHRT